MSKREWPMRFVCGHEECKESVTYRYGTRKEMLDSFEMKWYSGGKWKCSRHVAPNEILSAEHPETRYEITSRQSDIGRFFGNSGFVSGPGFRVWANDLPAGARLIVTARIELPASSVASKEEQAS